MVKQETTNPIKDISFDKFGDILTFSFTEKPQQAIAEEAGDDVWVRYDPKTNQVITVDVLNMSSRVYKAFGETLKYTERTDSDFLESLYGLVETKPKKLMNHGKS
jgi:hypothetical protein